MAVPVATTTITVRRPPADVDPYETATLTTVAEHVRARIGSPSGADSRAGGDQEVIDAVLWCDPIDLHHEDVVNDEQTGDTYQIRWTRRQNGLGLDHVKAGLLTVQGASLG